MAAPVARNSAHVSYRLCYHLRVAQRAKRSISLPAELALAIDQAAAHDGTTFSAWVADTAAHRIRLERGRQAILEWEGDNGALTPTELADGLARARSLLGAAKAGGPSRQSA